MSRVHEGVNAILQPLDGSDASSNPFGEETKHETEGENGDSYDEQAASEESKFDILDKIDQHSKKHKSFGFIKDLYYGMQIETTKCETEEGHDSVEESEFLMILLNIEVSKLLT